MPKKTTGKNGAGRPAIKSGDLCDGWQDTVLQLAYDGASEAEIRRELATENGKFSIGLWYALKKRDAEFLETIKIAAEISRGWWEKEGRINIWNKEFNHVLWFMNMKNRFAAHWRDKQEIEHSGLTVNITPPGKK